MQKSNTSCFAREEWVKRGRMRERERERERIIPLHAHATMVEYPCTCIHGEENSRKRERLQVLEGGAPSLSFRTLTQHKSLRTSTSRTSGVAREVSKDMSIPPGTPAMASPPTAPAMNVSGDARFDTQVPPTL